MSTGHPPPPDTPPGDAATATASPAHADPVAGVRALPPEALLLIASGCPHCPAVLTAVMELVKGGRIGRLEVVNVALCPPPAEALAVRTVPWLRLGEFEFEGALSAAELERWAGRAHTPTGRAEYLGHLLRTGGLAKVTALFRSAGTWRYALLDLLEHPTADLPVRLGASAVFEELAGSEALRSLLDRLGGLARHGEPHRRADACHPLALTRDVRALAHLEALLADPEAPVRREARECLEELREAVSPSADQP